MAMRAATASAVSGPAAKTVIRCPLVAPSPMTARTLVAAALLPPTISWTAAATLAAARASAPAGRACRSPVKVIVRSQLAGMPCLLRRAEHGLDVSTGRRGDRRGDRALHERRVRERDRLGEMVRLGEERTHSEHRAAQVGQDHDPRAGAGEPDRALDLGNAGADAPAVGPAPGHHRDF